MFRSTMMYVILVGLLASCGTKELPSEEHDIQLSIRDTIGVEMGDPNYVFGAIVDATFLPDGRIAVLDVLNNRVSLYDQYGKFIDCFGSAGNGPGEFAEPSSFTVVENNGFAVADNMHGTVLYFDSNYVYEREITGFSNSPYSIRHGLGESVIGMQFDYKMEGSSLFLGTRICTWEDTTDPVKVYTSEYVIHDDSRKGFLPTFVFDTDYDGNVVSALHSETEFRAVIQNSIADTLFIIDEPWVRRAKTTAEITYEHMRYRFDTPGFSETDRRAIADAWEPNPYSLAISDVRVDTSNRIWLKTNIPENPSPAFRVYNMTGMYLGEAITDFGPDANNWTFVFRDSLALAFDSNSDKYPMLFIMSVNY